MSIRNVLIAGILMTAALAVNAETAQQDKMKGCNCLLYTSDAADE